MLENLTWTVLIPLWCSILIMATRFSGIIIHKKQVVVTSCISVLFPLIFSVIGLYYTYNSKPIELSFNFISINNINFNLGIYLDILNSLVGIVICLITFIVYLYSSFYMEKEKSYSRYYSLLNIFLVTMLTFIFSPNLFQMFICWELISVLSYLLIGYWYYKPVVSIDSKRVFLINIIGDIAFFLGFVIISNFVVSFTGNSSLSSLPFSEISLITSTLLASTTPQMYSFLAITLILATFVKSAQFPFNSWLINAMSAPTPVSALIHSSTLVMAGVFLLLRVLPIITSDILCIKLIIAIGFITAIITSLSACVQTNIKKVLAYSTSAQLGLVFVSIGYYNPIAGVIYLISHAFIKVLLFLCAGNTIKISGSKNIMFMGNLRQELPYTALCFIISALALSGLGFCGFNSKCLLTEVFQPFYFKLIFGAIGILTTFYIFRLYFIIFEGKGETNTHFKQFKTSKSLSISFLLLTFIIICGTFIIPTGRLCYLYLLNLLSLCLVAVLYYKNLRLPYFKVINKILHNGFYINKIYYWGETYIYRIFANLVRLFDTYIIGGIEYLIKSIFLYCSNLEHKLQTNNVQLYITYGIWILLILMLVFILMYMSILNIFGV